MQKRLGKESKLKKSMGIYRSFWLFCIYDTPMQTREERRDYNRFRRRLKRQGFVRMQKSCYACHLMVESEIAPIIKTLLSIFPPAARIHFVTVSDIAFARQVILVDRLSKRPSAMPSIFECI